MSVELQYTATPSGTQTTLGKNNVAHEVHSVQVTFNGSDSNGTFYTASMNIVRQDNDPNVGDLIDWNSTYQITIEKL